MASPVSGIKVTVNPDIFGYPYFEDTTDANGEVTFDILGESFYTVFLSEAAIGRIDAYIPQSAKTYTLYKITNSSSADITISLLTVVSKTLKSGDSVDAYPQEYIITTDDPSFSEWSPSQYFSQPKARTTNFTMPSASVTITPTAASYAYLAQPGSSGSSNDILYYDIATKTLKNSISVGTAPYAVAITSDGSYVYSANVNGDNFSVIDTSTNTVVATITPSSISFPQAIAANPKKSYMYGMDATTTYVMDTTTHTLVNTITGVGYSSTPNYSPNALAVTPDGNYIYACNSSNVSVIDTSTNTVTANIPVSVIPVAVAITPDGEYAYVAGLNTDVFVIDTSTNTITKTIDTGGSLMAGITISPDGKYVFVSNSNTSGSYGSVTVIDTSTNTVTGTISTTWGYPVGMAVDSSSTYLYITGIYSVTHVYTIANLSLYESLPSTDYCVDIVLS